MTSLVPCSSWVPHWDDAYAPCLTGFPVNIVCGARIEGIGLAYAIHFRMRRRYVRAVLYHYSFTTEIEKKDPGTWWRRTPRTLRACSITWHSTQLMTGFPEFSSTLVMRKENPSDEGRGETRTPRSLSQSVW